MVHTLDVLFYLYSIKWQATWKTIRANKNVYISIRNKFDVAFLDKL